MTSRQRVTAAIRHQPVDRIARGEILIDDALVLEMVGGSAVGFYERREFINRLGLDLVCLPPRFKNMPTKRRLPSTDRAHWPDLNAWAEKTELFVFILLDGPLGWGVRLMGFEPFLLLFHRQSALVEDFVQSVERFNLDLAQRAWDQGGMGVIIADDVAYQKGLLVSGEQLRRYIFPSLKRQVNRIAALQMPVFFHSDGAIHDILEDIAAAGFQGLQGLESAAGVDMAAVQSRYGKQLCLWGNLDPRNLCMPSSGEEITDQVRRIMSVMSGRSGFIFGTSSGLYEGMLTENLKAAYASSHFS